MREEFKKLQWALYLVILAFIVLIFASWGSGGRLGGSELSGDVVLQVGSTSVTAQEFYKIYQRQVDLYRQIYRDNFNPEMLRSMNVAGQVINQIVEREILANQAVKAGIQISNDDVFEEIMTIPAFKDEQDQFVGKDRYVRILQANRMEASTFEADLRKDLLVQKYRQLLKDSLVIPEMDIREEYMKQSVSSTVNYLFVQDSIFESQVTVTEEDLTVYYESHRDEFDRPERRKITYLLADLVKIKPTIPVDDAAITTYYETHQDEFRQEEQVEARHILIKTDSRSEEEALARAQKVKKDIDGGMDFAEAAKKYSEDPSNAQTGGNLGFFGRGRMVPPFEEAAFSLPVGTVSDPVKTSFGYHIIEVMSHKNEGVRPLAEVEFMIRDRLSRDRAEEAARLKAQDIYASLAGKETLTDDELRSIADSDPVLTFNTTDFFADGDTVPGIGKNDEFMSAVFSAEMTVGKITAPIKIGRGYAICRLASVEAAGVPPLENIKDQVTASVRKKMAHEKGQERLLEMIAGGSDLDGLARAFNLKIKEDQQVRYLSPIPILGNKKTLHDTLANVQVGVLTDPMDVNNGWALFVVKERKALDTEDYDKQKDSIRDRLKDQQVTSLIRAAVDSLKEETKIIVNQEYLARLS
ncbi:MAG TPA: SurA N-terminal domain-containing protein [Thermoanaerobaculia bacterium]|nr:SurA N-terminal domain-containing protein [Thermoanaerobaculia bacterium]HUM29173.1 SurA N-terminal domain-containing protein [Thermoanaerobaculia bacterium]HXK67551.1 SurA N-terminal domain-containing protein [Thermoanaerobaculia bacterium]